jgi:hypothetical protein
VGQFARIAATEVSRPGQHHALPMTKPIIRIIRHEESIEVRVSRFFFFDENPGRRSITKRLTRLEAEAAAKATARDLAEDD